MRLLPSPPETNSALPPCSRTRSPVRLIFHDIFAAQSVVLVLHSSPSELKIKLRFELAKHPIVAKSFIFSLNNRCVLCVTFFQSDLSQKTKITKLKWGSTKLSLLMHDLVNQMNEKRGKPNGQNSGFPTNYYGVIFKVFEAEPPK